MKRSACWFLAFLLSGVSASALADGDSRPATQPEKEYSLRVLTVLSRAPGRPLAGYEVEQAAEVKPFDRVSPGCEAHPMAVSWDATWVNPEQAAREQAQEGEAIQRISAQLESGTWAKKQQELAARQGELSSRFAAAIQANDARQVEKVQQEMEALGKELEQLGKAQEALIENERKDVEQRSRLVIRMDANRFHDTQTAARVRELDPVSGHPAYVYRDDEGSYTPRTTVLVGPWKKRLENDRAVYTVTPDPALPSLQVQALRVTVEGDPSLARKALEGTDWQALQGLLERP